ncbi:unnamed protein product [Protopolystoma xenopodis]|uniref:Uncharacterized protein n=1 Tax=Protopolystoma xenopodis TaxID=117903 RepID=A0A3S5A936_9PLAT|nr:unnamed protein product [Protopolystoma xenopodis]
MLYQSSRELFLFSSKSPFPMGTGGPLRGLGNGGTELLANLCRAARGGGSKSSKCFLPDTHCPHLQAGLATNPASTECLRSTNRVLMSTRPAIP